MKLEDKIQELKQWVLEMSSNNHEDIIKDIFHLMNTEDSISLVIEYLYFYLPIFAEHYDNEVSWIRSNLQAWLNFQTSDISSPTDFILSEPFKEMGDEGYLTALYNMSQSIDSYQKKDEIRAKHWTYLSFIEVMAVITYERWAIRNPQYHSKFKDIVNRSMEIDEIEINSFDSIYRLDIKRYVYRKSLWQNFIDKLTKFI